MRKWKDTIENGRLFAELDGSRRPARVLVLPITYGRNAVKSGHAFHYGSVAGIAASFAEAKAILEQIAERREARR